MCDEYVKQPLGEAEVSNVWMQYNSIVRSAMENDVYTHGGLLDNVHPQVPGFYASPTRTLIEGSFTYEEMQFISRCRLFSMTVPDIERLIGLLNKYKDVLSNNSDPINTNGYGYFPQRTYRPFQPYYVPQQSTVQPLYGCPAPNSAPIDGITPRMDSNSLATISMPNENGIVLNTEKVSLTEDSSAEAILKRAEEIDNAVRAEKSDEKCGD